jgi:predicted DNA-binding transcriptional regulator YafY
LPWGYRGKSSQIKIESEALDECNSEAKIICSDTEIDEKKYRVTNLKIERLIIIHKAIKKGTFPNTNELRDLCRSCLGFEKLSTATISRDIEFLRTRFNAPIEYDAFENGYYYKKDFDFKF